MTNGISPKNNRKLILTATGVLAFGVGAYGLGRVYPPTGPSAGTVGPAQRYVSAQVGQGDVTLGDTSVPELMQTDAFELMVHNPEFRALAGSPGFKALTSQPQVLSAILANPVAFNALSKQPGAFDGLIKAAEAASAWAPKSHETNAQLMNAITGHWRAFDGLAGHPDALLAILADPLSFGRFAHDSHSFSDAVSKGADAAFTRNAAAFQKLAGDQNAMKAISSDPQVFASIASNAGAFKGLSGNPNALTGLIKSAATAAHQLELAGVSSAGIAAVAANPSTFSLLAAQPE
ncbi:MAG TPA: hypothetical protein VGQ34_03390, partial [Sphingomicrobium sp.]|nr:hypothetical protein [Sphingomicrobium sp.]